MDGKTLMAAMTYPGYPAPLSLSRYNELAGPATIAMGQANCTTQKRVDMMLAQVGAESGSLRWQKELASGTAYDRYINPNGPWRELGNTERGDGAKFKGHSYIQITGRTHHVNLSIWAYGKGLVPTRDYFVTHPSALAADKYAWLGPVWYWLVARPGLNAMADKSDINGATYAVNGGYNNLSGRTARWHKCLSLGSAVMSGVSASSGGSDMFAYKYGSSYFLFAGGQRIRHVGKDYAANVAALTGRPLKAVSKNMHLRMVKDQAAAAKGGGLS